MSAAPDVEVSWPFTGREAELEHVRARLGQRSGAIVLAGPAGVGKTRLGLECLGMAASHGFVPMRVAGTQGAAGLPFGAFAHLVPEQDASANLLMLLRQLAGAVTRAGDGKPVALLVDDVHRLDESSAALTQLLARTKEVFLLATLRSGEAAPEPIVALWKDGLAERRDIRPFSDGEVENLLAAALGPVDRAAVQLLQRRTEGNVLFLRELVLSALESGALRQEAGIWRLGTLPPASDRLAEMVGARLGHLDERDTQSLATLALGEPLEVELLRAADPGIDLPRLERRGLVRVEVERRRLTARLPHPLYAEVLRARMSALQARERAEALAGALDATGARRREDGLRLAVWSLDGGRATDPERMLAAARVAHRRYDLPLAERLAQAALDAGGGLEAGLLHAQVCWLQGRGEEAVARLGALDPVTDEERALAAIMRMNVLDWALRDIDGALRAAEEAEATLTDPECRNLLAAERARILGRTGRHGAAVAIVTPLLQLAPGRALVSACMGAATSMTGTGQFAAGIAASERGLATHLGLAGPPPPFGPYLYLTVRARLLYSYGRLDDSLALGSTEYEKAVSAGSVESQSFHGLVCAGALLLQGRVATAARYASESLGGFRDLRWNLWVRNSLALWASALALLGDIAGARAALAEVDGLGVPASEYLGTELLQSRAWTEVAAGDLGAARARLEEAVALARWSAAPAFELAALHDLARLGRAAEVAARMRELATLVEGPLATAFTDHATSLAAGDGAGLDEVSAAFEEIGALLLAAEAAADAAAAWRKAGEPRRAAAAERRSQALAARCEGARTPALATASAARAALTPREIEIARLAAAGLGDKEIAARLFLSRRTVGNKLYSVYAKLGVAGRAELGAALEME